MRSIDKKIHFKTIILIACVIFLLCFIATFYLYSEGLKGPLILDDEIHIQSLLNADYSDGKWKEYILSDSGLLKRPVAMATFILNAVLSGDNLYHWKYINLVIHFLTSFCIFIFSYHLLLVINITEGKKYTILFAIIPAIIWLLHPLHVSTVLYTVQRMTQLSALFVFAAMATYLIGRIKQLSGKNGWLLIAASFFLFMPLGIFSKENALLFPVYALLLEIFFLKYRININGVVLENKTISYLFFVPIGLVLVYFLFEINKLVMHDYIYRDFTLETRILTQFRVLLFYISQIILPLNSRLGFIHDDFEWSDGWLSPPTTIISFFVILSMLLIAWKSRNKLPIVSFGIFFYFSGHLMESTVVPLEMVFEHRNYLPSYGIILVFTGLLYQYVNSSYTRAGIILLLASTLSFQTKIRADIWSSTSTLYEYMIKVKPGSARLAAVKARILEDSGLYDDAINVLSAHINKGSVLQRMSIECSKSGYITDKKLRLATEAFNGPVDMYAISEVIKLANLGLERRCRFSEQNFIGLLEKMLDLPIASDFEIQRLLVYKAHYLWKMHEYSAAFKSLEEAAEIPVYDPIPYLLAAEWSVNKGNIVQARKYYESAKLISENSNKSYDQVFRAVEKLITEHDKPE